MKAIDRLADVQANLDDAEKEAEAARRDSKRAKDDFQELKKKRYVFLHRGIVKRLIDKGMTCLLRRTSICRGASTRFTRILPSQERFLLVVWVSYPWRIMK